MKLRKLFFTDLSLKAVCRLYLFTGLFAQNRRHISLVKVSMESSLIVSDILRKSKELKKSVFSHVFLKPDRTLEQRLKHKKIVAELKKSIQEAPDKHHFIKNGEVCHQEKVVKQDSTDTAASVSRGSGVKKEKKNPRKLLPHHITANRRPPLGYTSPLTTDTSDCD